MTCTVLLELLDHAIEIGIAGAKASRQPVPAALSDPLAVREHVELTGVTRPTDGFNVQALLDEGHETRDFGVVVLSRRAVNDFNLHSVLQSASCAKLIVPVDAAVGCKDKPVVLTVDQSTNTTTEVPASTNLGGNAVTRSN